MFLDKLPQKNTQNSGENMGEEVRQVMREQALHEKQYSELIMEQAKLSGIYNKDKLNEVQETIKVRMSKGMLTQTQGKHQKSV
jgi:hypothetical protein